MKRDELHEEVWHWVWMLLGGAAVVALLPVIGAIVFGVGLLLVNRWTHFLN
jgi:hypothetical protein